jgi:hypothetical protein
MTSVDLLGDYYNIYFAIIDPIKEHHSTNLNTDIDLNNLESNHIKTYLDYLYNQTTVSSDSSESSNIETTIIYSYIDSISRYLDNNTLLLNNDNNQEDEDMDEEDKSKLQLKEENFKKKKKSLKILQIFLSIIFGGLGLFILTKTISTLSSGLKNSNTVNSVQTFIENKNNKTNLVFSSLNNISFVLILFYIVYLIVFNFEYYIKLVDVEFEKYDDVKNKEIRKINTSLIMIKTLINDVKCNDTINNFKGTFDDSINTFTENIKAFNKNYLALSDSLLDNRLAKEDKIKDINILFNNYKDTVYTQNNKFGNITVDNEKHIVCLLNILLYLDNVEGINEDIVCSFNNSEGLKGLIRTQKKLEQGELPNEEQPAPEGGDVPPDESAETGGDVPPEGSAETGGDVAPEGSAETSGDTTTEPFAENIFNGFENISTDDADVLYFKITESVLNESNKFELMNMKLFKIIVNMFKIKIHKYDIKKHEFVAYIYSHFENLDLKKNNIPISKFDIINNYKVIINIIYKEYDLYKKLQITENKIPRHQITLNKFNEIIDQSSITNIEETEHLLITTIKKIEKFKSMHGKELYNDIRKEQRFNKSLEYLCYIILSISLLQIIKILYTKDFDTNFVDDAIDVTKYLTFILLLNSIILSYWYRKTTRTDYSEMVIKNNDNEFIKELNILNSKLQDVKKIKNLSSLDRRVISLLNENKISFEYNTNNDKIFSLDIGDDKVIIDERDVKNIIYEKYYIQLSKILNIHECCSFLTKKKKVPVFPWTDFTINLIFYIIIFLILFNVFLINDDLNPFAIINNLKSRLLVNKTDLKTLKSVIKKYDISLDTSNNNQSGGNPKNTFFKQENLINLLIIYLSLLYTYKIYESTFSYRENIFK